MLGYGGGYTGYVRFLEGIGSYLLSGNLPG